jgi:hypothetical protein
VCDTLDIAKSGPAFKTNRVAPKGDDRLYIPRTIRTAYGPRLISAPSPTMIPTDRLDALALASQVDREADHHLSQGRIGIAERLSHLALECRARATGSRA